MPQLVWNQAGDREFETGVDQGVLYLPNEPGVPWTGLVSIAKSVSGADVDPHYADSVKFLNLSVVGEFTATIEAYGHPDEFSVCDGTIELGGLSLYQQARKPFGMSYRTKVGNDIDGTEHDHKIHLIYNALVNSSKKVYSSVSNDPEAMTFTWDVTTTPMSIVGFLPSSSFTFNLAELLPETRKELEDALYGTDELDSYLPMPDEVLNIVRQEALIEDLPDDPGTYIIKRQALVEDPTDPGTYLIVKLGLYEDDADVDPGIYLMGIHL